MNHNAAFRFSFPKVTRPLFLLVNRARNTLINDNQDGAINSSIENNQGVNYQPDRLYPHEEVGSARYSHSPLSGETH